MVIPPEQGQRQVLSRVVRRGEEGERDTVEALEEVRFVPLIGREGVVVGEALRD